MNNHIRAVGAATLILLAAGCATDTTVQNKRAPGMPGEKTFQIQVGSSWVGVSDQQWDACEMGESYPACLWSSDR